MGKFIDKRLEGLKESLGFDFEEMVRLAQEDPEEFLRRKREIFRQHLPDLDDEELDTVLARLNLTPAQGEDEPLDTVVANMVEVCSLVGKAQQGIVSIVQEGAEVINRESEEIGEICQMMKKVSASTIQDCEGVMWHLREIKDNSEKTSQGLEQINQNLATQEAGQIPEDKKH